MWNKFVAWFRASWKAVIALLTPIAFGAASEMVEALGDWASAQNGAWVGIAVGALSAVGVWLKSNEPA